MKRPPANAAAVLALALCLLCSCERAAGQPFSGGAGTEADPYRLSCADDLYEFAHAVNTAEEGDPVLTASFRQTADIDLAGREWTPVGYDWGHAKKGRSFQGHYDGAGYKVENLSIVRDLSVYVSDDGSGPYEFARGFDMDSADPMPSEAQGFFGLLEAMPGNRILVENVTLEGVRIRFFDYGELMGAVGAFAGRISAEGGGTPVTIRDCTVRGVSIVSNCSSVGGFVGESQGDVQGCRAEARIEPVGWVDGDGFGWVGGFVGRNLSTIRDCTADVRISPRAGRFLGNYGFYGFVGGFVGDNTRPLDDGKGADEMGEVVSCSVTGAFELAEDIPEAIGRLGTFCYSNDGSIRGCGSSLAAFTPYGKGADTIKYDDGPLLGGE